ncbi:hypothetical protein HAX54_030430 [Datura stramonium]|uniref:Uncharacterized protein n=1 Tax=Datura stramonium TaxID=4076 RepID=A0ABS8SAY4_DATST|nr:hypothetical protein [Datura stramonium]
MLAALPAINEASLVILIFKHWDTLFEFFRSRTSNSAEHRFKLRFRTTTGLHCVFPALMIDQLVLVESITALKRDKKDRRVKHPRPAQGQSVCAYVQAKVDKTLCQEFLKKLVSGVILYLDGTLLIQVMATWGIAYCHFHWPGVSV